MPQALEILTVGRVGVDLYPEQTGVPLAQVRSFAKSLGGTATNVAVAAARLGRQAAVLTKVGADGFGDYVRTALTGFGVDPRYVGTSADLRTPVVFCALDPPEDPPLLFYREPVAPDLTITGSEVPDSVVRDVPLLWITGTGASREPSRSAQLAMLATRGRPAPGDGRWTVLDLDWRPMFWDSPDQARAQYAALLDQVTVAIGNRAEVEVAVGTADPALAATRLLDHGVQIAVVKLGAAGVLVATRDRDGARTSTATVPPQPVEVVCGLGAGDAFGGAFAHGLLAGWPVERCAEYGNAAGAIVASRLACADAMPTRAELDALLQPAAPANRAGSLPLGGQSENHVRTAG